MNQEILVKQRRKTNVVLMLVFFALLGWVMTELSNELKRFYRQSQPLTATKIELLREGSKITLVNQQGVWQVTSPYQHTASSVVIDALLSRLQQGCRQLESPPARTPQHYADIVVDEATYRIGELNHASDEVYVANGEQWLLCDKLLASMALAPAINFIDKQLYKGQLHAIVGDFGRLTDFSSLDLSVMEIAPAEAQALPQHAISSLTFEADNNRTYASFLSEDGKHLLLFDKDKSLIYVLATQDKLTAIMGL